MSGATAVLGWILAVHVPEGNDGVDGYFYVFDELGYHYVEYSGDMDTVRVYIDKDPDKFPCLETIIVSNYLNITEDIDGGYVQTSATWGTG